MSTHRVTIVQCFKARREITIEVEGENVDDAVRSVEEGETDTPDFDDPQWGTTWGLQSVMVFPADPPAAERASENGELFRDDGNSNRFVNFYKCEDCGHEWEDEWSCTCEDDCPECGVRHMTPCKSEDAA